MPVVKRNCIGKNRGMTILEVTIAFAIFITAALAIIQTVNASMIRSEVNRQLKVAIIDAQAMIDRIQGTAFDEICDIDYGDGVPSFPQGKQDIKTKLGFDPTIDLEKHLNNEAVYVYYFKNSTDQASIGSYTEATMAATKDASNRYYLGASSAPITLYNDNNVLGSLSTPPDPLRLTVVIFWDSPFPDSSSATGFRRMRYSIPFMVTRMLNDTP